MNTVEAPERWYEVRQGRILFFADPSGPGVDKRGNVWAHPGHFVEASHPVLRKIVALQRHKLRQLKEGETIPAGSIIQGADANPYIKRLMDKHDGKREGGGTKTAEELVVGDKGKTAPALAPAPEALAAPVPQSAPPAAPVAPAAPPAPTGAEATNVPSVPPAAPPPPGGALGGEAQTIVEGDMGRAEDLGII